jgi:Competence protein CoiA-like family
VPRRASRIAKGHGPQVPVRGATPVLLAWARDRTGAKVSAARLAAADRRARAPFTCLGCGEALVPHLGKVRARHFAHQPGSRCPLTAPETALHLDAKERLLALCADAFAGRRRVGILARCAGCRRTVPQDLAAVGDAAEGEAAVGLLRADVLVRARGRPVLAFEVRVTHAVDEAKEAALAAAGLPFVEIDAREEWERDGAAGGVELACARSGGFAACPACTALERADADRGRGGEAAEVAELEAYRARGLFGPVDAAGLEELKELRDVFRCPDCGSRTLQIGERIARHPCRAAGGRPVAWRSYGGALVALSWWRRAR